MQFLGVLVLACLLCSTFTLEDSKFEDETYTEGDKNIMIIRDKGTGMVVTEIDVFDKQEYQLIKPEDEDICFVAEFSNKVANDPDKQACFKRVRAPEDIQEKLQIDLSACEDREVVFLKPTGCRTFEQGFRQKRACITTERLVSVCVQTRHECTRRNLWGKCRKYEELCVRREHRKVTTTDCT